MAENTILIVNAKGQQKEVTERIWDLMKSSKEQGNKRKGYTFLKSMTAGEAKASAKAGAVKVAGPAGPTFIPKEIEEAAKMKAQEASAIAGATVTTEDVLKDEGFTVPSKPEAAPEPAQEAPPAPVAKAQPAQAAPVAAQDEPAQAADDMTKVPHTSVKSIEALRSIGITTYAKLADASIAEIEKALDAAGLGAKKAVVPKWKEAANELMAKKA
jgi:predicted flap endonuclease-1-like 5' DNA nuclease